MNLPRKRARQGSWLTAIDLSTHPAGHELPPGLDHDLDDLDDAHGASDLDDLDDLDD